VGCRRGQLAPDRDSKERYEECPPVTEETMASRLDVSSLIRIGTEKGYLTYGQVSAVLAQHAGCADHLDEILGSLEHQGIELLDEAEAEDRAADGPVPAQRKLRPVKESRPGTDDPVRMFLSQMGEIPLLKREEEIALAKLIEVSRKRFRLGECQPGLGSYRPRRMHIMALIRCRPSPSLQGRS
jgi:hypothetical protein